MDQGIPNWLGNRQVVVIKTRSGWLVGPETDSPPYECISYAAWLALSELSHAAQPTEN